ncbi:hypothetical protein HERIO_441 [Hepatospora eriocheir]|uniref:Uncharacterized protein n=1 Tax=Hepatospora eriocheir TaxID=1081669 RepID=A0A1X0QD64_9MICR|nr:hypothetical protein HERIO_441 [Hepatospora eriocheir]
MSFFNFLNLYNITYIKLKKVKCIRKIIFIFNINIIKQLNCFIMLLYNVGNYKYYNKFFTHEIN